MRKLLTIITWMFIIASCSSKTLTMTSSASKRGDAVFSLIVPDNNYGKLEDIHTYCWTQGGELNVNRVLIDFDLSQIPKTAIVEKAYLTLSFNPTSQYDIALGGEGNKGDDSILIQRVISDWTENEVTWNRQPQTTQENQVLLIKQQNREADYKEIDITKIVEDIIREESGRFGILVRHKNEVPYNVTFFASGNHPDKSLHPRLSVVYR